MVEAGHRLADRPRLAGQLGDRVAQVGDQEIAEVAAEPVPRHDAQHGKVLEMRRHRVRGNQPASLPQRA